MIGTDIYVPPSGGGGGGAPPPQSNLTSIIEISPYTTDIERGKIPAPLQAFGTVCKTYNFENQADYNATLVFTILGEDYNLDNTANLVAISAYNLTLTAGEIKPLEVCVYYPSGHTENLKSEILVSGTNYAEKIDIFMSPPAIHFIVAFFKKYGLIIAGIIAIIVILSQQNTKSLNKLKYKLGL